MTMPSPIAERPSLLSPAFMARLDQLDVISRKLLAGKLKGERRGKHQGQSVEFADYRNYVMGDDPRFIDWNLYARLDRLFLKLFVEEEDLSLYILIDVSKSCDYGNPSKSHYIKQVAAALGYVGLVNYNRVALVAMADGVVAATGALRGRRRVRQMIDFCEMLQPAGPSRLADSCRRFALQHRRKGVCVVLSDFFDVEGYEPGLRYLAAAKHDLFCMQVLSPQEIEPDLQGDLTLRDLEDDATAEVSITSPLIDKYKNNLNAYCQGLKQYVGRRGGAYLFASTAVPFDTLVLNYLRERRLLE
jgi:uncharacterized protein (DUF58 family)